MTQRMTTKENASAPHIRPQGASGSKVLDADGYQTNSYPSAEALEHAAAVNLQNVLRDLEATDNIDAAKIYADYILDAGRIFDKPREMLRSIEARLPQATPTQQELASVCRDNNTGAILFCRCIGAFYDDVLIAHSDPKDHARIRISKLHIPRTCMLREQVWDMTRPQSRRTLAAILDADATQAERNNIEPQQHQKMIEA